MYKKFFTAGIIFCMSILFFNLKCSAAEFELVSYSAHARLQWLANTGNPIAKKMIDTMGKANIYSKKNLHDFDRLETLNGIYEEILDASVVEYVQKNNYKNIMDVGCGYAPRAITFANEGRKFVGVELAAVAVSASGIMDKVLDKNVRANVDYEVAYVEDEQAMLDAAKNFKGKICVADQGLMIYIDQERLALYYENLQKILKKHGGCFITADMATRELYKDIIAALYGKDQVDLLYAKTKDMYEELFEGMWNEENFDYQIEAVAYAQDELNLKIDKVPLITDFSKLSCVKNLSAEQVENLKKVCAKNYLWVLTAK